MIILNPGYSVTISLANQETLSVDTRGSLLVEAVSGLGLTAGVIGTTTVAKTYGPYPAGLIKLTATLADSSYGVNAAVGYNPAAVAVTGGTVAGKPVASILAPTGNKVAIIGNSIISLACLPLYGVGDAAWAKNTAYTAATFASPSVQDLTNGYLPVRFQCTTGGTSSGVEPVFSPTVGGTVTDGTCIWTTVANVGAQVYWTPSWWHIAQGLSGQRLNETFVVGRSGQISTDILLYLPRVLASNPDIVFFANLFENDTGQGSQSNANITANWAAVQAAMEQVRAAGKRVMVQTVLPNLANTIPAASKQWLWLNAQIRDYARARPDVIFFDAAQVYADANPANVSRPDATATFLSQSGTGTLLQYTDGVHPYGAAHWKLGLALSTVLAANFPAVPHFSLGGDLNYQSKNPGNFGTSGTAGANVTAASVPTSMTLNAYGTMVGTVAASLVPRTDINGNWLQFNYNATVGDNLDYNTGGILLNNFAVGDVVQGYAEVKILANPVLLKQIYLRMDFQGTSYQAYSGTDTGANAQDLGQFLTVDTTFTVKTVPMAIPAGCTGNVLYSRVYGRGAANFTAQLGRQSVARLNGNPALV